MLQFHFVILQDGSVSTAYAIKKREETQLFSVTFSSAQYCTGDMKKKSENFKVESGCIE